MSQLHKPVVEALKNFQQQHPISFHVPGHKNGELSANRALLKYDMTELTGLDDLHHPEECLDEAQQLLAQAYKADQSFFLVNGSTVGNLAMIYATCQAGDDVFVQRNAHKSIFHALELVGARPILLTPEWHTHTKTAGHITANLLKQAIDQYPQAKALIITSPTYYGVLTEQLAHLIHLAHEAQIPVLVDEAHGAHFMASEHFPASALQLGADIVVQSAHKTLNAMTMASFLHIRSNLISISRVQKYLRMLQSSSPSYVLLASLDEARYQVANYSEQDYEIMMQQRQHFITQLNNITGIRVIEADDPLKICLRFAGYSGFQVKEALEAQHIYAELADNEQVLFVLPLLQAQQTYRYDEAVDAIVEAVSELQQLTPQYLDFPMVDYMQPITAISPMAIEAQQLVTFDDAIGCLSAGNIIPYPPGIPLLIRGEIITSHHIEAIQQYQKLGCPIQGEHNITQHQLYVKKESTS